MTEIARCQICGEPMPPGEEMFKHHGYSGDCPKPPLHPTVAERDPLRVEHQRLKDAVVDTARRIRIIEDSVYHIEDSLVDLYRRMRRQLDALAAFEAQHPEVK